jgi:diguanylate cyclase (GGDEF)-like protein
MRSSSPISFAYILEQVDRINQLRWIFIILGVAGFAWSYHGRPELWVTFLIPAGMTVSSIVFELRHNVIRHSNWDTATKGGKLNRLFFAQVILDIVMTTAVIHVTGGSLSPIPILYIPYLSFLVFLFPARQFIVITSTTILLYAGLMGSYAIGLWNPLTPTPMESALYTSNFTLIIGVAFLIGIILNGVFIFSSTDHIQRTWRGVDEQRTFLDGLNALTRVGLGQTDLKRLYQMIVRHLGTLVGADKAYIIVLDDERESTSITIYGSAENGNDSPATFRFYMAKLANHVRLTGDYLSIEDVHHSPYLQLDASNNFPGCAVLGLPLFGFSDRRFLGTVLIAYNKPHTFLADEIERTRQAVDFVALLLSRMRLYEESVRRAELLQELSSQITSLTSDLKRTTLLPAIVESARNLLKAQRAALYLYDKTARKATCEYSVGLSQYFVEQINARFSGIPGAAVIRDQPFVLIPDIHQDSRTSPVLGLFKEEGFRAYAMFSLPSPSGSFGALAVYWDQPHAISSEEIAVARMFAARAGGTLHNASLYAQASEEALTDAITQLPNRRYLDKRLEEETLQPGGNPQPFTLIMIDLDGFKAINDSFGHPIGDSVLQQVSLALRHAVRSTDFVARYGGDEFAVILSQTEASKAQLVAEKLRAALATSQIHLPMETERYLSACMGLATYPYDSHHPAELIQIADMRLYKAKHIASGTIISTDQV